MFRLHDMRGHSDDDRAFVYLYHSRRSERYSCCVSLSMADHRLTGFPKYLSFVTNRVIETAVWAFAELGIADLLAASDQPQTADQLANKQGWNSECLYRLLRTVTEANIVREIKSDQNDTQNIIEPEKTTPFQLTDDGHHLTSTHPSKARYLLCWELSPVVKTTSNTLPQLVREGFRLGNGFQQTAGDRSIFEYFKREENQQTAHYFNEAMTSISTYTGPSIVKTIDFARFHSVVDIGGNLGVLLSTILEGYPSIQQGICFDLPSVIQQSTANREFEIRKISKDRYQLVAGDMFDCRTIPRADAYILQNILHDWDNERSIEILKSIRTAGQGQPLTLFIIGFIILPESAEDQRLNQIAHAIDLHMMMLLSAKERTQQQHEYLLAQSGFTFKHLHRTDTAFSIVEAVANESG